MSSENPSGADNQQETAQVDARARSSSGWRFRRRRRLLLRLDPCARLPDARSTGGWQLHPVFHATALWHREVLDLTAVLHFGTPSTMPRRQLSITVAFDSRAGPAVDSHVHQRHARYSCRVGRSPSIVASVQIIGRTGILPYFELLPLTLKATMIFTLFAATSDCDAVEGATSSGSPTVIERRVVRSWHLRADFENADGKSDEAKHRRAIRSGSSETARQAHSSNAALRSEDTVRSLLAT